METVGDFLKFEMTKNGTCSIFGLNELRSWMKIEELGIKKINANKFVKNNLDVENEDINFEQVVLFFINYLQSINDGSEVTNSAINEFFMKHKPLRKNGVMMATFKGID